MANPTEKECKTAFQKLQDYLPDGTHVRIDWVQASGGFYQITGGYVIEEEGQKRFDPSSMFMMMCFDPVGIFLIGPQKFFKMRSFDGAVRWLIDSFKGNGFNLKSPEVVEEVS
jgi:hypothetical protein